MTSAPHESAPIPRIFAGLCILLAVVLPPALLSAAVPEGSAAPDPAGTPIPIRILAVNDFHGQISPGKTLNNEPAGSAPVLGSYLISSMATGEQAGTVLALPGDVVGASPPESGLLLDEPTILFFNTFADTGQACTVVATLGNHEFDKGVTELLRKLNGGDGTTTIPHLVDPFPGSRATYVCSNVVWTANETPIIEPYTITEVGGAEIAFIGADTVLTSELEMPANLNGVSFRSESESINRYVPEIQKKGVHAIVVLLHEGGEQDAYEGPTREGGNVTGRIAGIVAGLDPDIDVVLSGHTHAFTNAFLENAGGNPVLVVQAYSYSVAFAEVDLGIDPETGDITEKTARIVPAYADSPPGTTPDPAAACILADAERTVAPMIDRIIATAATNISRTEDPAGESALGDLVADSQRAAMAAEVAFVTTGSLRADIEEGNVTWGDLYAVQPFGDTILSMTLTGGRIREVLEQQWQTPVPPHNLAVSGLTYTFDPEQPAESRIVEVQVGGAPLEEGRLYCTAVEDYLASGGDDYSVFTEGTNRTTGPVDLDALIAYIEALPQPVNVTIDNRIEASVVR